MLLALPAHRAGQPLRLPRDSADQDPRILGQYLGGEEVGHDQGVPMRPEEAPPGSVLARTASPHDLEPCRPGTAFPVRFKSGGIDHEGQNLLIN